MAERAYIVEAVRTAGGKRDGRLSLWHPADLGAKVLDELVTRLDMDPALVDDVVFGCVDQVGAQSGNVARNAILSSSFPESVPGTSVDRQCGSSQQAIHFAIQAVMSGTQDIVIGGGVEVMSMVPIGAAVKDGYDAGHGLPFDSEGMKERYPGVFFSQFTGAELVADKWNLSREDLDKFALESHQKAAHATESKYFDREILPVEGRNAEGMNDLVMADEGIRFDASLDKLAGLNPVTEGGVITAGNASQITDGAAAVMVCNVAGLNKIQANPHQPRKDFNDSKMEELVLSIKEKGILQPIAVRELKNGNYEIIAGERRYRASKAIGLKSIPAYILSVEDESEIMEFALIENIQRDDLNPIEESEAYASLKSKYNLSQKEISKKVGKSRSLIANSLRLLKLPSSIKEDIKNNKLSMGHAVSLLGLKSKTQMLAIANRIIKNKLSVRNTEEIISKINSNAPKSN